MVKHTQTIRWQIADELFECIWPFCEIGAKTVRNWFLEILKNSNVLISHWDQLQFSVLLSQLATKYCWSLKIVNGLLQGELAPIFALQETWVPC